MGFDWTRLEGYTPRKGTAGSKPLAEIFGLEPAKSTPASAYAPLHAATRRLIDSTIYLAELDILLGKTEGGDHRSQLAGTVKRVLEAEDKHSPEERIDYLREFFAADLIHEQPNYCIWASDPKERKNLIYDVKRLRRDGEASPDDPKFRIDMRRYEDALDLPLPLGQGESRYL